MASSTMAPSTMDKVQSFLRHRPSTKRFRKDKTESTCEHTHTTDSTVVGDEYDVQTFQSRPYIPERPTRSPSSATTQAESVLQAVENVLAKLRRQRAAAEIQLEMFQAESTLRLQVFKLEMGQHQRDVTADLESLKDDLNKIGSLRKRIEQIDRDLEDHMIVFWAALDEARGSAATVEDNMERLQREVQQAEQFQQEDKIPAHEKSETSSVYSTATTPPSPPRESVTLRGEPDVLAFIDQQIPNLSPAGRMQVITSCQNPIFPFPLPPKTASGGDQSSYAIPEDFALRDDTPPPRPNRSELRDVHPPLPLKLWPVKAHGVSEGGYF